MSQLLSRLESALAEGGDPIQRAELNARRACYLARIGRFDEVRQSILELRSEFGGGHNARISAWIMLVEGVAQIFEDLNPMARDRIARAQLVSLAIRDRTLGAISSAWKAHVEFETSDFPSMVRSLKTGLDNADDDNHDALARLAMVLADTYFICGDRKSAQPWFMKSRLHAIENGDQATMEALLYNRAAFGMSWLRAQNCFTKVAASEIALAKLEVASARNFQDLTKVAALKNFVGLCEARILMLEEQFESAIDALNRVRSDGPFATYNFNQKMVDLELALCYQKLGNPAKAEEHFPNLENYHFEDVDIDDQLVVTWIRKCLAALNPKFGNLERLVPQFEQVSAKYLSSRADIQAALTIFETVS